MKSRYTKRRIRPKAVSRKRRTFKTIRKLSTKIQELNKLKKAVSEQWSESFDQMDENIQTKSWHSLINKIRHSSKLSKIIAYRNDLEELIKLDILSNVPYELTLKILSYLDPFSICRVAQTCRYLSTACQDRRLWWDKCKSAGILDDKYAYDVLTKTVRIMQTTNPSQYSANIDWKQVYKNHHQIINNWRKAPYVGEKSSIHIKQLKCHEDHVITCLQFNPKSNIMVSGSDDHTLRVWCAETGECIRVLKGHKGGVWCSQITPEDIVISGSTDRTLKIWDPIKSGEAIHTLNGHASTVRCIALFDGKVVSGSRDTSLKLWDVSSGKCLNTLCGHNAAVRCVEFKNNIIVSGAYDHLVKVWDAETGLCVHTLQHHTNRIYCLQLDGDTIASGSLDSTICIWNAKTGELKHQLKGHTSLTSKMQLRNNLLVSANADSFCKLWDVQTGTCLHTLGGDDRHTSAITSVYFNNWNVITSGDDGTVKLWDLNTGKFLRNLIVLPSAAEGGVVWRIRASYTKLICAVGARTEIDEDTHLLVLDLDNS